MPLLQVDDIGDVTITNDGATILKQLDVEHPAAKVHLHVDFIAILWTRVILSYQWLLDILATVQAHITQDLSLINRVMCVSLHRCSSSWPTFKIRR